MTGLARSTLYEAIAKGEFPKPIKIHGNAVGWVSQEVDQWMSDRISVRDSPKKPRKRPDQPLDGVRTRRNDPGDAVVQTLSC